MSVTIKDKSGGTGDPMSVLFFSKVSPLAETTAKALLDAGATLKVEFQAIKVSHPKYEAPLLPLPANTSAVIKQVLPPTSKQLIAGMVEKYLGEALYKATGSAVGFASGGYVQSIPKPDHLTPGGASAKHEVQFTSDGKMVVDLGKEGDKFVTQKVEFVDPEVKQKLKNMTFAQKYGASTGKLMEALSEKDAKALLEGLKEKFPQVASWLNAPPPPSGPAPKYDATKAGGDAVLLKDATLLGQPVKGTSAGSVYRVCAIGERIRMACRVKGGNLSVRVEPADGKTLTTKEKNALVSLNFTDNGHYLSSHFSCGGVPAERVLGVLFFHPDLKLVWKVESLKEVAGGN